MKLIIAATRTRILAATAWAALVLSSLLVITAYAQPQKQPKDQEAAPARIIPLELGRSIPLAVQSPSIEWKSKTFHLVTLGSIQFKLDKTDLLKADIQAGVMTFDDVVYDISVAVFDATKQLLGTARAQCKVERVWLSYVLASPRTLSLDFGVSLDYARATAFMVSVSKRKVLTPDEWQK